MADASREQPIDYASDRTRQPALAIQPDPPTRPWEPIALILLMTLAGALRFHAIGQHCFWLDETATLQLASGHPLGKFDFATDRLLPEGFWSTDPFGGSAAAVVQAVKSDTHPPLYLLCLRYWRQLLGPGDAAARSLSAGCGLIALLALFDAVRVLHGRTAAWWAAILMCLATPQIEFAQETRSYMMVAMWATLALSATARMVGRKPTALREAALAAALFAGVATHYYAVSTMFTVGIFALTQSRSMRLPLLRATVLAGVAAAVTLGPLVWVQRHNFHDNMTWISDNSPGLFLREMGRVAVLPLRWFIIPLTASLGLAMISSVLYLLPWLRLRAQPRLLIWTLLMTFTVALPTAADLINGSKSIFQLRYTLSASVAAYALAATLLLDRGWMRHLLPACLLMGCLIGLPQAYEQTHKINWDILGVELAKAAAADEPIVFYQESSADWHGPAMQAGVTRYGHLWDRPLLAITRAIDGNTRQQLLERKKFWLVTYALNSPIDEFVPGARRTGRGVPAPYVGLALEYTFDPLPPTTSPMP